MGSDETHASDALKPYDLRCLFLLLGLGLGVGLLLALLELLSRARSRAKDGKVGRETHAAESGHVALLFFTAPLLFPRNPAARCCHLSFTGVSGAEEREQSRRAPIRAKHEANVHPSCNKSVTDRKKLTVPVSFLFLCTNTHVCFYLMLFVFL